MEDCLAERSPTVDVGADFGVMETIDGLLDAIHTANERGYKRVKLNFRPGWDLPMIEAVRKTLPRHDLPRRLQQRLHA